MVNHCWPYIIYCTFLTIKTCNIKYHIATTNKSKLQTKNCLYLLSLFLFIWYLFHSQTAGLLNHLIGFNIWIVFALIKLLHANKRIKFTSYMFNILYSTFEPTLFKRKLTSIKKIVCFILMIICIVLHHEFLNWI